MDIEVLVVLIPLSGLIWVFYRIHKILKKSTPTNYNYRGRPRYSR